MGSCIGSIIEKRNVRSAVPIEHETYGERWCRITKIVDGDTIRVVVKLNGKYYDEAVRFSGINAPETRGESRQAGLAATAYLKRYISVGDVIKVVFNGRGKYGRLLGTVYDKKGVDLCQEMLNAGHAVAY